MIATTPLYMYTIRSVCRGNRGMSPPVVTGVVIGDRCLFYARYVISMRLPLLKVRGWYSGNAFAF